MYILKPCVMNRPTQSQLHILITAQLLDLAQTFLRPWHAFSELHCADFGLSFPLDSAAVLCSSRTEVGKTQALPYICSFTKLGSSSLLAGTGTERQRRMKTRREKKTQPKHKQLSLFRADTPSYSTSFIPLLSSQPVKSQHLIPMKTWALPPLSHIAANTLTGTREDPVSQDGVAFPQ